jgi:hypothetical protein
LLHILEQLSRTNPEKRATAEVNDICSISKHFRQLIIEGTCIAHPKFQEATKPEIISRQAYTSWNNSSFASSPCDIKKVPR